MLGKKRLSTLKPILKNLPLFLQIPSRNIRPINSNMNENKILMTKFLFISAIFHKDQQGLLYLLEIQTQDRDQHSAHLNTSRDHTSFYPVQKLFLT